MRLSHRLSLLIGIMLMSVLSITLLVSVHNSRSYLNLQLSSHAQDAATSLGLALSTALAEGDQASVISMTNAIFDRGDYVQIRVEDRQGRQLFERTIPIQVDGVPAWFVNWLPLATPEGIAKVMAGWRQSGQIVVKSHPGYAYIQLWENSRETISWIGLSALLTLGLGLTVLRGLLAPLYRVEAQADAICRREFPEVSPLPKAPEFARIVVAMNRMSRKVKEIIGNLETLAHRLQAQAYKHPVTGLANKRHFTDALADLMTSDNRSGRGALVLIQIHDFKQYNELHGYQAGDKLLRDVAERLREAAGDSSDCLLAHLSGADFALLAEDMGRQDCTRLVTQIVGSLGNLRYFELIDTSDIAHIGALIFGSARNATELLARADATLRSAQSKGPNATHVEVLDADTPSDAKGASEQRQAIRMAIEQEHISCQLQPVVDCPARQLLHYEALARLRVRAQNDGQGELLTAGRFVPTAASIGLGTSIDRAIIQLTTELLATSEHSQHRVAINFAPSSLDDPRFITWLLQHLDQNIDAAERLALEMPEFGLKGRVPNVRTLIEQLHRRGCRFGLDRYGRTDQSITNLKALKLDYIKIDGAFVQSLEHQEEHQFFIHALADIAHGLDIEVLVEAVEKEAVWELLPGLKVDGAQGYFLGRPE